MARTNTKKRNAEKAGTIRVLFRYLFGFAQSHMFIKEVDLLKFIWAPLSISRFGCLAQAASIKLI
jgi:hypothetical protein